MFRREWTRRSRASSTGRSSAIATMTRTSSSGCTRRWRRIACLDGSSADRRATAPCPTGSIRSFRDRDELPGSSNLGDNIVNALQQSRSLIVVCSPRASVSRWVNEEVLTFKRLGREDRILCLIVDGEPNATERPDQAALECFPDAVRLRLDRDGQLSSERTEPLAADVRSHADGRANAKLKLIAGLLGVGFDELRQRERQRVRRRRLALVGQGAIAVAAMLAAYVVMADGGVAVPGVGRIQTMLDRHNASLLRPVHADTHVAQVAAELAQEMTAQIFEKEAQGQFLRANGNYDLWNAGQALAAVLHSSHAREEDRRRAAELLAKAFDNDPGLEANGIKFGWATQNVDHSQVYPSLWMIDALGMALGHPGAMPDAERGRYERMLLYAIETTGAFYPIDGGGWNMFPRQVEADLHNDYASALAMLALLDLRAAGIELPGNAARRDELIGKTARWLMTRRVSHETRPGWLGDRTMAGIPLEGLTLQIYGTLLRARAEAGIAVPDSYFDDVFMYLERMMNRAFSPSFIAAGFQISFVPHTGQRVNTTAPVKFLWYPWAIACARQWLAHARNAGADPERVTKVRRVLGYLVVDLKSAAIDEAKRAWPWIAADILYGLSEITPPRR